jgi:hypothetical protein
MAPSGFWDFGAILLADDLIRLGAAADVGVQYVDGGELFGAEFEVEDVVVPGDARRRDRLRDAVVRAPRDPQLDWLRTAKTAPEIAWLLRDDPYACLDHCVLDDAAPVVADLVAFAARGGRSIIGLTPPGIGRDPA